MSEVFISYSRNDQVFVQGLRARLERVGLEVWVDVDGLYAGEEFWPEVAKAIDAAVVFVFVMSPDSIASRFCRLELEQAVSGQKRIVPLCRRDVDAGTLGQALASRQWVFFRDGDDADAAEASLLSAVRADWARLREQARLMSRAREWQQKDRNSALLLRGSELRTAEQWLAQSRNRESGATPLHEAYITASRQGTRKWRLRLAGATLAALVIVAVVGWFALSQKVASLSNRSLDHLNRGQTEAAIDKLERARAICRRFGFMFEGCTDAGMNLGRALLDAGRYREAVGQFTGLIDKAESAKPSDVLVADFLGTAYQNRTFGRIMLAETYPDEDERLQEYVRAEKDLATAIQWYEKSAGGVGHGMPVEITQVRILIGRGQYALAQEQLERVARFSNQSDINLLLSVVYHCRGDGLKSIRYFQDYLRDLPRSTQDPQWLRYKPYYTKLRERCSNSVE